MGELLLRADFPDHSIFDILRYICVFFDILDKFWAQFGHSFRIEDLRSRNRYLGLDKRILCYHSNI